MLRHPLPEIRALAAVAFGEGQTHGPAVPEDLKPDWRAALLDANPDTLPQHSQWRLEQVLGNALKTDPVLCADWFVANAERPSKGYRHRRSIDTLPHLLRSLPREQKRRIVEALDADALLANDYASELLGYDEQLASDLLAAGAVDTALLLRSLSGYRDATVEGLSSVLVFAGVGADVIARQSLRIRETVGSFAASIREDITFFADLAERRTELADVCASATSRLEGELDEAVTSERMDRLAGW